jgi:hypothetical protein
VLFAVEATRRWAGDGITSNPEAARRLWEVSEQTIAG